MQSVIKFSTTTGRNGKLRSTEILIFYHQQPNINECSTFLKRQIEFIVFENSTFQLNFSFRESWHRYFQHSPQTVETTNLNMFLHKLHRLPRRKYKINAEHYGSTMLINSKCRLSACKIFTWWALCWTVILPPLIYLFHGEKKSRMCWWNTFSVQ